MRTLAVLSCLVGLAAQDLCRCAERSLAEYFTSAQEVFVATLVETEAFAEGQRRFHFELQGAPYKVPADGGPPLPYVSSTSSASCGVVPEPGAVYVVFAEHDRQAGVARLTTCNGTRIHRHPDGTTVGFEDVPPGFVVAQLAALAGAEALRRTRAATPRPGDPRNESLVGLLDVAGFSHAPTVPLTSSPGRLAEVVDTVSGYEGLEHRESGYEVDAATVYAVSDGWYKVRRAEGGFAWLPPDAAGTYWPVEELVVGRLTYLEQGWNRWVWPDAGAGNPTRLTDPPSGRPREQPVNVLRSTRIADMVWLEVEVLASSPCEGGGDSVRLRGWIPAHDDSGAPVVWYYSRGC